MRRQQSCAAGAIGVMLVIGFGVATARAEEGTPTFSEDVAPILYDFNWQTYYIFQEPLRVPKGTTIAASAWYDNSAANKSNPDATMPVRWGEQTWEEMQLTGITYTVPRKSDK